MKRKYKPGRGGTGKKLAKLLTASLVMNPLFYMLPQTSSYANDVSPPVALLKAPFVKSPLPDLQASVGKPLTIDLGQYFEGAGSYTSSVSQLQGFSASVSGNLLTLNNERMGTATVSVTGTSTGSGSVTDTFEVSVLPEALGRDQSGKVGIGQVTAYVGSHPVDRPAVNRLLHFISPQTASASPNTPPSSKMLSLSVNKSETVLIAPEQLFEDADNDALTIETFSLGSTGSVTSQLINNRIALTGIQPGSLVLKVTVNDGRGGRASNSYPLTVVDSTNHAPVWNHSISQVSVTKGTYAAVDLRSSFTDEDAGDQLFFNPVQLSQAGNYIQVSQNNGLLSIYGAELGSSTVTASVYDGRGGTAQGSFGVTVTNATYVNHAPVAGSIEPRTTTLGEPITFPLSSYFYDPDGDQLFYTISNAPAGIVTTSMTSGQLTIMPQSRGTTVLTLTATDTSGASASASFGVTVANRAPVLLPPPIPLQTINHTHSAFVNLTGRFTDPDGDMLDYSAITDLGGDLTVTPFATGNITAANISGLPRGTNLVTLKAADSFGGSVTDTFTVDVLNNVPVPDELFPTPMVKKTYSTTVRATDLFIDEDSDSLTFSSYVSDDPNIVSVTLASGSLKLTGVNYGSATVTVAVSDNHGGTANRSFQVIVNDPPTGNIPFDARMLNTGRSLLLDPTLYYSDPNQSELNYSVQVLPGGESVVSTAALADGSFQINGTGSGTATIRVTAKDSLNASTEDTFTVEVYDLNQYYVYDSVTSFGSFDLSYTDIFAGYIFSSPSFAVSSGSIDSNYFINAANYGNWLTLDRKDNRVGTTTITVIANENPGPVEAASKQVKFNFYDGGITY
ncbi:Ig-like domain-containing protein [Paenibacillus piri]|uniref:BIG2 domain-containing protein n=1 Tax=Paenibacillus piri TaxID=2547395 RepID=A0A4R5KWE3_9BACL|nr:putative Ig domain-containing protein [Paenibacillus piri]TDG00117.1 hypothetical protein E1757_00225 [Paenibacillus piri]